VSAWKTVRIGDFISVKHGYAFPGEGIVADDNGVVLVTPGNFKVGGGFKDSGKKFFKGNYPAEYVLKAGDFIVTMTDLSKQSDTLGYSAIVPCSSDCIYLHNQRIGLVEFHSSDIDRGYLYWLMRTKKYQQEIVAGASGTTVKHTSPSRICGVEIQVPPLVTQRRIAAILSSLDDKIENNRKICKNLEELAQAIFKSWFVDFEPFGGEMPKGWKMGKLEDLAEITMGQSPDGSTLFEAAMVGPARRAGRDMAGGSRGARTLPDAPVTFFQGRAEFGPMFPTRRLLTTAPNRMARQFDILLSVRAPVGDLNIALEECCIGRGLAALHSRWGSQAYLWCLLKSLRPAFDLYEGAGTIFGSINKDSLRELEVVVPDVRRVSAFENAVGESFAMMKERELESRALAELRDALLPKLMSGEVEVEEAELQDA